MQGDCVHYKVGEKVIYPNQGVGIIEDICTKNIAGSREEFYMLRIVSNNSTVMIPTANIQHVGIRRLCDEKQLRKLFNILEEADNDFNPNWKNRYKNNVERMNSGSIFEVARVLKNLYFLNFEKSLSFREKKMFDRARQLVISEIATVRDKELNDVEESVEKVLTTTYNRLHAKTAS